MAIGQTFALRQPAGVRTASAYVCPARLSACVRVLRTTVGMLAPHDGRLLRTPKALYSDRHGFEGQDE